MLTIRNLTAGYGKLEILHAVDLDVAAGQFVAILGPNGSGKSTLLKSIFGLTDVMGGTITCDGQPVLGRRAAHTGNDHAVRAPDEQKPGPNNEGLAGRPPQLGPCLIRPVKEGHIRRMLEVGPANDARVAV